MGGGGELGGSEKSGWPNPSRQGSLICPGGSECSARVFTTWANHAELQASQKSPETDKSSKELPGKGDGGARWTARGARAPKGEAVGAACSDAPSDSWQREEMILDSEAKHFNFF